MSAGAALGGCAGSRATVIEGADGRVL